jgi:hypothetical protein
MGLVPGTSGFEYFWAEIEPVVRVFDRPADPAL